MANQFREAVIHRSCCPGESCPGGTCPGDRCPTHYYRHTGCFQMKLVSLLYQCAKQFIVNFPPRPNLLVMSKMQSPIQDINQPEKFFSGEHEQLIADFFLTAAYIFY